MTSTIINNNKRSSYALQTGGKYIHSLYCGLHSPELRQIFSRCRQKRADSWFADKELLYVHKARVAIRLICDLLCIGQGDVILVPAYNCGSEISPLLNSGASVLLYQIDRSAHIDVCDLKKRITENTKAIYVTHYFGFPHRLEEIRDICDQYDLFLVEDCALSLFSCDQTVKLGTIGDVSVFSFPKTLPVPDGGLLVINNPHLVLDRLLLRNCPVGKVLRAMLPLMKRWVLRCASGSCVFPLLWSLPGLTRRLSRNSQNKDGYPGLPESYYYDEDISKIGISRLTRRMLNNYDPANIVSKRRINFQRYLDLLAGTIGITPLYTVLPEGVCPLYFPIIVNKREHICQRLNELSIDAIAWWAGYHTDLPWAEYPDAGFLKDNLLALPVHEQLNAKHVEFIAQTLLDIVRNV